MKLNPFIYIFTLIFSFGISAQETMLFKDKQYPGTTAWDFMCDNYALSGKATIQIAKAEKGGVMKILINTTNSDFFIGGIAYIYLADYSAIACTDKNLRQKTENGAAAFFYLTESEMTRLKSTDIQSVRFNIRGKTDSFSSQTGNFTAINKKSYFGTFGKEDKNIFETAKEIVLLYK